MNSMFHQIIVAYDVSDTKVRNKLFGILKDFGLVSIQKSVMWGHVTYAEERAIYTQLKHMLALNDKGFVLRPGDAADQITQRGVGYEETKFEQVDEHDII